MIMPALLIKNLPPALHRRLKQLALGRRRSLQQEALLALERGMDPVRPPLIVPEPVVPTHPLDDDQLRAARRRGR